MPFSLLQALAGQGRRSGKGLGMDGRLMADLAGDQGRCRDGSAGSSASSASTTQFTGNDATYIGSADLAGALDLRAYNGWSQQRTALISQLSNVASAVYPGRQLLPGDRRPAHRRT